MTRRIRFHPRVHAASVRRQAGCCARGCGEAPGDDPREIRYDRLIPLQPGGEDIPENLPALRLEHRFRNNAREAKARARVKRIRQREGLMKRPLPRHDKAPAAILQGPSDG